MLRFSCCRTDAGERWVLCGQLAGPWVGEVRSVWRSTREGSRRRRALVDLKEVTFIDEAGERLLVEMRRAGAELVAAGVEHQHLIAHLNGGGTPSVRRRIENLGGGR